MLSWYNKKYQRSKPTLIYWKHRVSGKNYTFIFWGFRCLLNKFIIKNIIIQLNLNHFYLFQRIVMWKERFKLFGADAGASAQKIFSVSESNQKNSVSVHYHITKGQTEIINLSNTSVYHCKWYAEYTGKVIIWQMCLH